MLSKIIDFLLGMFRDEDAKQAFEADPQGTLSQHGLQGVTGDDIRDARLIMADRGDIRATGNDFSGPRHADPVREIHHTTTNFEVRDIDQTLNVVNIDDRDTLISDSFNSNDNNDVDVVAIQDNDQIVQDNDQITVEVPSEESTEDDAGTVDEPVEEPEVVLDDPVEPVEEPFDPPVEAAVEPVEEPVEDETDVDAAIV